VEFDRAGLAQYFKHAPIGFVDVGMRGGVHELMDPVARVTSVLGFEPDAEECQRLNQSVSAESGWASFQALDIGLAAQAGVRTLHLLAANTNHSLLAPNAQFVERYRMEKFRLVGQCNVQCDSLDEVLRRARPVGFRGEFIKLDTQGSEHEILEGAAATLAQETVLVVTEVAFCEIYRGQKRFSEIEQMLREKGFSFYGFGPLHRRSRKLLDKRSSMTAERLLYADAHFFRDPLERETSTGDWRRAEALAYTGALLLGYYDYALELAAHARHITSGGAERAALERLVKSLARLDPRATADAVEHLAQSVSADQAKANVLVGGFVDGRRQLSDYDDIRNVSPAPRSS
jgi:FkbM family methyltransferase